MTGVVDSVTSEVCW